MPESHPDQPVKVWDLTEVGSTGFGVRLTWVPILLPPLRSELSRAIPFLPGPQVPHPTVRGDIASLLRLLPGRGEASIGGLAQPTVPAAYCHQGAERVLSSLGSPHCFSE